MRPLAAALLMLLPMGLDASPAACHRDGVEWLLGGVAPACDAAPTAAASVAPAPAGRLRVSSADQQRRDDSRLGILQQELREAEAQLSQLRGSGDAAALQRLRADIGALHKEIARMPRAAAAR